jgi:2-iminobutanoate/2-iminopropanoate deaminase
MPSDEKYSGVKQRLVPGTDSSIAAYSPGIAVDGLVFVSGQGPLDLASKQFSYGSIEHETELTIRNVQAVLAAADCVLDDCVKVTVHLADIGNFDRFNAVYARFFSQPYPARTTVQSVLGKGISIEIDAIAVRRCGRKMTLESGQK